MVTRAYMQYFGQKCSSMDLVLHHPLYQIPPPPPDALGCSYQKKTNDRLLPVNFVELNAMEMVFFF